MATGANRRERKGAAGVPGARLIAFRREVRPV